jgi:hypothetical protein
MLPILMVLSPEVNIRMAHLCQNIRAVPKIYWDTSVLQKLLQQVVSLPVIEQ